MKELSVLHQILGNKFHSCILATYSIDFYFLEQRAVAILRSKGIRNISVLADATMLDECLGRTAIHVKRNASSYGMTSMPAECIFHPKLYLFIGSESLLLLIGSGNLTSGGMGKNHEAFVCFYADNTDHSQLPLILQAWAYLEYLTSGMGGITQEQKQWIKSHCDLFPQDQVNLTASFIPLGNNLDAAFISDQNQGIFHHLKELIGSPSSVTKITLVSPFFDKDGYFLKYLEQHFPEAVINVIVPEEGALLPDVDTQLKNTTFYKWEQTEAAKRNQMRQKSIQHSKIYHFQTQDQEFLLLGSCNATKPAFLDIKGFKNHETAILLRRPASSWLSELGLVNLSDPVNLEQLRSIVRQQPKPSLTAKKNSYHIYSIDKLGSTFTVHTDPIIGDNTWLHLFNGEGLLLGSALLVKDSKKSRTSAVAQFPAEEFSGVESAIFGYLVQNNIRISRGALINDTITIQYNHPSPIHRKINQIIDLIESGQPEEKQLEKMYILLHELETGGSSQNRKGGRRRSSSKNKSKHPQPSHVLDMGSQVVRVYSAYIKQKEESLIRETDEEIEIEEEGNFKTGNRRQDQKNVNTQPSKPVDVKLIKNKQRKIIRVFNKYIEYLALKIGSWEDGKQRKYMITLPDYALFLLLMDHLFSTAGKTYLCVTDPENIKPIELIPLTGFYKEEGTFNAISISLIGKFLLYLNNARGEEEPMGQYEQKLMEQFRKDSYIKIMTSFCYQHFYGPKDDKYWHALIKTNLLNALDYFSLDFMDIGYDLEHQFNLLKETKLSLHECCTLLESLYIQARNIICEPNKEPDSDRFIYVKPLRWSYVIKTLPINSASKDAIVQLSNPCLSPANGFIYERYYNLKKNNFLKSRQKYQDELMQSDKESLEKQKGRLRNV